MCSPLLHRPVSSRTKAQGVKRFPVTCDSTVALLAKPATSAASTQPGATEPVAKRRKRGVHQQNFLELVESWVNIRVNIIWNVVLCTF